MSPSGGTLGGSFMPLKTFLSSSRHTTIGYQGNQIYEVFALASFSRSILKTENPNYFLYTPFLVPEIKNFLRGVGVRFEDEPAPVNHVSIYQDDSVIDRLSEFMKPPWDKISGYKYNPNGKMALAIRKDMPLPPRVHDNLQGNIGSIPFSWQGLIDRNIGGLLTNDWQIHFAMRLLDIPSVLFTGPRYPSALETNFGIKMDPVWVRDEKKGTLCACQCSLPKFCHDRSDVVFPCMRNLNVRGLVEKISWIAP